MRQSDPGAPRAVLSRDTDGATERLQVLLWQRMSPGESLRSAAGACTATLELCLTGISIRAPAADENHRFLTLARIRLGTDLAARAYHGPLRREEGDVTSLNPIDVALLVAGVLEGCGLRYVLGGSLASSVSGEPRSTLDVDLMVDISEGEVPCVIEGLGTAFHAEHEGFTRAIRAHSSVNVIHLPTATKVDLFVMGASPIEPQQMDRRIKVQITGRPGTELYVYTPEDILLQKLRWYRMGRETSDRQWRDILGIAAVQAESLDLPYLRTAAAQIEVSDLLQRALSEAGPAT